MSKGRREVRKGLTGDVGSELRAGVAVEELRYRLRRGDGLEDFACSGVKID